MMDMMDMMDMKAAVHPSPLMALYDPYGDLLDYPPPTKFTISISSPATTTVSA